MLQMPIQGASISLKYLFLAKFGDAEEMLW